MAPKNKIQKRNKKVMNLGQKLKMLDLLKTEKVATVAKKFNVNESTIRSIRAKEMDIRKSVSNLGSQAKFCKINRGGNK